MIVIMISFERMNHSLVKLFYLNFHPLEVVGKKLHIFVEFETRYLQISFKSQ